MSALADKCATIARQLGAPPDAPLVEVVAHAEVQLGLPKPGSLNLVERADRILLQLGSPISPAMESGVPVAQAVAVSAVPIAQVVAVGAVPIASSGLPDSDHPLSGAWEVVSTTNAVPYLVEVGLISPCVACCISGLVANKVAEKVAESYGTVYTFAIDEAAQVATLSISPAPTVSEPHKPYYGTHQFICSGSPFHTHLTLHDPGLQATATLTRSTLAIVLQHGKHSQIEYHPLGGSQMARTISCNGVSMMTTYNRRVA